MSRAVFTYQDGEEYRGDWVEGEYMELINEVSASSSRYLVQLVIFLFCHIHVYMSIQLARLTN